MKAGVLSIGTNSTRALVADLSGEPPSVLLARSTGTRIGEGLREGGRIDETAARRTLDALAEHVSAVRALTHDYCAIATSALRRADNADAFAARVRSVTGVDLDIIGGEEEARRSFAGALAGFHDDVSSGVLDVGGGSAEYAVGSCGRLVRAVSCEIGAVRLTEAHPELRGERGHVPVATLEAAAREARGALAPVADFPAAERIIMVGGTATTAVSVGQGERRSFAYAALDAAAIGALIARLAQTELAQRKAIPGINPQRADILLGGLLILREFLLLVRQTQALVSTNDLLLGTLLQRKR